MIKHRIKRHDKEKAKRVQRKLNALKKAKTKKEIFVSFFTNTFMNFDNGVYYE